MDSIPDLCLLLYLVLFLGAIPWVLALGYYHSRTRGHYGLRSKLLWYGLVAAAGVVLGVRLTDETDLCRIALLLLAATPIYAVVDRFVIFRRSGQHWGIRYFMIVCFSELYTVILAAVGVSQLA